MRAAGDEAREMRHVGEQGGVDRIGDPPKAGEINRARIGRAAADDEPGPVLLRQALDLAHVDEARRIGAIEDRIEPLAGQVHRCAVAQVAAGIEGHAQYRVARLEQREKDRLVRLAAGMGLDVGEGAAEELLGPLDGEGFDPVGELGAAVVARARPAFHGLVDDDRAQGVEARAAHQVLRRDQLDPVLLACKLARERRVDLWVNCLQVIEEVTRLACRGVAHWAAAGSRRQSSASGTTGVKSVWCLYSGRANAV